MRTILIATGDPSDLGALAEQDPAPMLPFVDRPFLQHVVESLASRGFTEFDLVVSHLAHRIEDHFGDGTRWGITIRYHVARDADRPYRRLLTMSPLVGDTPVLLCHADRFPSIEAIEPPAPATGPILYCKRGDWTGWAWICRDDIKDVSADDDEKTLAARLFARTNEQGIIEAGKGMSAGDFASILAGNIAALSERSSSLLFGGREVEPGLWISRNVILHPTARLIPPVYLCEDCKVGEGAEIGPGVVVGSGCVLDRRCSVANAVVFPSTYVGEGVDLHDVLVVRDHLIDVRTGLQITLYDEILLGTASGRSLGLRLARLVARATAVVALAFTWPILLATAVVLKALGRGGFSPTDVVSLPASTDRARWKTYRLWRFNLGEDSAPRGGLLDLLLRFLPGLLNVARGELRFVGVPPRSAEAISALPEEWKALYLRTHAGLITESNLFNAPSPDPEGDQLADAYYAVAGGKLHDVRLVAGYLGKALFR